MLVPGVSTKFSQFAIFELCLTCIYQAMGLMCTSCLFLWLDIRTDKWCLFFQASYLHLSYIFLAFNSRYTNVYILFMSTTAWYSYWQVMSFLSGSLPCIWITSFWFSTLSILMCTPCLFLQRDIHNNKFEPKVT